MSGRFLLTLMMALVPASGLAAQQPSTQTTDPAKPELTVSQQPSFPSTNTTGVPQQQRAVPSQGSLGDVVRQQRLNKQTGEASASGGTGQQQKSLGEIAAERRVTQPTTEATREATRRTGLTYRKARRKPANPNKRDPFAQPPS